MASACFTVLPSSLAQMQAVSCRYHRASPLPDLVLPTPPLLIQEASLTPQCDIEPPFWALPALLTRLGFCLLPLPLTLGSARGKTVYSGSVVSVPGPGSSPQDISLFLMPWTGNGYISSHQISNIYLKSCKSQIHQALMGTNGGLFPSNLR